MNTETEAVEQEEQVEQVEEHQEDTQEVVEIEEKIESQVPLSALQKERRKRQDSDQKVRFYEELQAKQQGSRSQAPQEENNDDQYEAATKADLKHVQKAAVKEFEENSWVKNNPGKVEDINQNLTEFLKQRPHLTSAIENAPNRYEEAWVLMNALSPKQKMALKTPIPGRPSAPGSPNSVPKAAGVNQATDVMNLSDSEFKAWRQSKRKPR